MYISDDHMCTYIQNIALRIYLLKNNRLESIILKNFDYYTFWYFLNFLPVHALLTLYFSGMHYADSV